MTIRVALNHNTYYKFDRLVNLSKHTIRLRPGPHCRTPIHSYSLKIHPKNHFINWQQDAFGNFLASIVFPEKTDALSIEVEVLADMVVINPFDFFLDDYAEQYPFTYTPQLIKELAPYREKLDEAGGCGKKFKTLVASISLKKRRTIDFLVDVNQMIQQALEYAIRMEPGVQTPEQTLALAKGSCRDSAWLMVQVLRDLGLAARFASGYLVQLAPDEKSLDGPSGTEKDFTDLHAWCEVFLPGAGWVGLDPTSGLFAGEGHIPLACTPDPSSAAPIEGAMDECEVEFEYSNEVSRFHEDPRVTKPYTDTQWAEILALGDAVDNTLEALDVRLTMGGEPTFVSIDDMESEQWNTAALGADKLARAKTLLLNMRDRFAPKGLLHYGQGKWYPGEEVPRWALGVFWRKDGEPVWDEPELLARVDKHYGHTVQTARQFSEQLADTLGISQSFIHPAYEDGLHYLLQEQRLPKNVDALVANTKDTLERKRLARVLGQGFDTPTGFVLPIERDISGSAWCSSQWQFRRDRLILIPGDSPMGLRLPLDDLPETDDSEYSPERDPFDPEAINKEDTDSSVDYFAAMNAAVQPDNSTTLFEGGGKGGDKSEHQAKRQSRSGSLVIRTALCIEAREGKLHVFLPPVYALEDYLAIVAALQQVAQRQSAPIIIEGYEPPKDARMQKFLITPDPGVIEVNIHPANNWKELVTHTTQVYAAARQSRLAAEKFMLDGRHTGTGGGNHMTLGGKTPADSPMLRRPDLLRSFVTFWQHHPSLSYLFSGTFVGPTSQAPRADEGRDEMLYEMEIAFQQMPEGLAEQPWLVDRLMRNLLIDITGNTHRAEFCIDKLYAPGSASGRQGILEFRGFEMPPHSRMSLVQALLIRALVARFWQEPYKKPLARWGTALHDKFMLPHFILRDIQEVCNDLNLHGFPFKAEWLLPFEEFRFPHYGRVKLDDIEIELRWAIEPWHVLGEEVGSFGTARYVDSSVERLQVKVSGLTDSRYVLSCNGRRVPLHATGIHGESVAGVRYRAWAPPSALHPTIGVHTPLTFDLIDTWTGRSVGGCTYHVSHPGGRSYDSYPVNAFEAESRRVNRYDDVSHSQGTFTLKPEIIHAVREITVTELPLRPMGPPPEEVPGEYPYTLDLRRSAKVLG